MYGSYITTKQIWKFGSNTKNSIKYLIFLFNKKYLYIYIYHNTLGYTKLIIPEQLHANKQFPCKTKDLIAVYFSDIIKLLWQNGEILFIIS